MAQASDNSNDQLNKSASDEHPFTFCRHHFQIVTNKIFSSTGFHRLWAACSQHRGHHLRY
jgi:hypothetical protein